MISFITKKLLNYLARNKNNYNKNFLPHSTQFEKVDLNIPEHEPHLFKTLSINTLCFIIVGLTSMALMKNSLLNLFNQNKFDKSWRNLLQ